MHGVRGAAFSHYRNRSLDESDWHRAQAWTSTILGELLAEDWPVGLFWNINFPCLANGECDAETVRCSLDYSPLPLQFSEEEGGFRYSGSYQSRRRKPGGDVDVCFGGRIAVTPLQLGR